jgi:hypothetical protein
MGAIGQVLALAGIWQLDLFFKDISDFGDKGLERKTLVGYSMMYYRIFFSL